MAEIQPIAFDPITLKWEEWIPLRRIIDGDILPPQKPGVYEFKHMQATETWERLRIGESGDLHQRLVEKLIKGKGDDAYGKKDAILAEGIDNLMVRWALTLKPAAVEEHLLQIYLRDHPKPKHNRLLPPPLP